MKKKILISTGGSGGHVIPALAFCDHLKENFEVYLTSDKRGSKFINQNKYNFEILSSPRLTLNIIKLPLTFISLIISILRSFFYLKNKKIDVLIGTGGYMSVSFCIAAKILNIKIYLFEPNMVIGRSNKFLLKLSTKLFCYSNKMINFPEKYINKMIIINHILRKEIYDSNNFMKEEIDKKINLLVMGGSQGAKIFGDVIPDVIKSLNDQVEKIQIYQQCVKGQQEEISNFYNRNNIKNYVFEFDKNILELILSSDLAITRCGASSTAELTQTLTPFIAIPLPDSIDNHQYLNAKYYENKECCWIMEQKNFSSKNLFNLIEEIVKNKNKLENIRENMKKISSKNVYNDIENTIKELI